MKKFLLILLIPLFSSSAFAGHFQDTLDDIEDNLDEIHYQLWEINQREADRENEQMVREFFQMLSTMSEEQVHTVARDIYISTSAWARNFFPWAQQFLSEHGNASDYAFFEARKQQQQQQRQIEQQKAQQQANERRIEQQKANKRWIEQQKANLHSPNPIVRKQARENLIRGIP
jgi:hypothetical protein